jgi:hypothetical protein
LHESGNEIKRLLQPDRPNNSGKAFSTFPICCIVFGIIIIKENNMPKPVIFAAGPEHLKREGLVETALPWEDGQRAPTHRGAFEWWYFDANFDDHTTAVIVYATKPIINPDAPLTPNLSLTVTRADGTKTAEFALPPADQFSASSEMCDVRIGANWAKQISFGHAGTSTCTPRQIASLQT